MSSVEVNAVISSIVSAFASGMDLFRRMTAKQKAKNKRKPERLLEEERQLHTSLQCRPREIRAEYDRSLARFGQNFAIGDTTAQCSLNHTLLVLNTGLIQILAHALSDNTKAQASSRRSLLDLSEVAAADAVRALEQLHTRLSSTSQITLTALPSAKKRAQRKPNDAPKAVMVSNKHKGVRKPRSKSISSTERKRPGPDPLVRGAWVRAKSGTAVMTASSSSSGTSIPKASLYPTNSGLSVPHQISSMRPSHHRTKSSPSQTSRPNPTRSSDYACEQPLFYPDQSPPSYHSSASPTYHQPPHQPNRQPSLLLASPEVLTNTQATTTNPQSAPPPPPKIPLQLPPPTSNTPQISSLRLRPRPPSVATFLTTSTKIGEIPEHRWLNHHHHHHSRSDQTAPSRPVPLPWEQQRPLPYVIPPRLEDEEPPTKKKGGRGFKFWKKSQPVAVS